VLAWIFRRCEETATTRETLVGLVPGPGEIDIGGLDITEEAMAELLDVDPEAWKAQIPQVREHFARFGDDLPAELRDQLDTLEKRLGGVSA